ncbi:MAG TPA: hypothetical protein VNM69_04095 [Bacillus sp. (in: firmicutes)]|uniref:hypothetical protein n=1 Tax=Bacillus litorisediminis TaxID=2922713 RepID=UPI001FAC28D3|nr:hypothetical protein [Bacillus litorisediminis]HWO75086.1 hypothetical protein [Bacillus sp. (in: firmicutes)]
MDEKIVDSFIVRVQKVDEDKKRIKVVHVQHGEERIVESLEEAYHCMCQMLDLANDKGGS